jgi:hypothetical protein|tara:strand:- start:212 stop:718 length:507 start_codon:yes stop_codon:yes gene_type:complete
MIHNLLRGFGLIVFILILIMDDFPFYEKMKLPHIQLAFAVLITSLCIYDYVSGFIYAMLLMLIYYEIYSKKKSKDIVNTKIDDKYNINMKNKLFENFMEKYETNNQNKILVDFISEKYLDDAQNGYIFSKENFDNNNLNKFDYDVQGISNNENNISGIDMKCSIDNIN